MGKYPLRRIGVASNANAVRPLLSDCIELLLEQSDMLAADVMDALTEPVTKAVASARESVDPDIEAAVLRLVEESTAVRATFCAELRRVVYQSGSQDFLLSPLGRIEDIHVFDMRVLEAQIEQALAHQEVLRAVDDIIPLFNALVSSLLGWTSVHATLNPMKPEAFERALMQTLGLWVSDETVRTTLVRPAATALGIGLRQLYRETCEWLRSHGVEPVQPVDLRARNEGGAVKPAKTELQRTMETLDKLRRLLGSEAPLAGGGAGLQDFTHTVPASLVALQDLKLVEPMIRRLAERSPHGRAQARVSFVAAEGSGDLVRSQENNRQLGRQLAEEVVRMMLDHVVQDERVMGPVRVQLRALEPLLVRLAKADPRFFIDRDHPARQLLDRVVQRSLGYDQHDEEGVYGFTACVANAVGSLLRSAGDAAACAQALNTLERNWFDLAEGRRKQREQERIDREHSEKRLVLAQRFSQALMERFKTAGVPELVAAFLRGPWSQVLAEARLRSPTDAPDPRAYLALVEDLVWSVQPPTIRRDYTRLVRLVPRLLARLNEGLVLIRYPREPITLFLDALSELHDKVLEDHRRAMVRARAAADSRLGEQQDSASAPLESQTLVDARGPPAVERRARPRNTDAPAHTATNLRELQVGDWVDLALGGEWVRAEMTWVSPNRSLFMFISGAGLAHAMSRRTMDRLQSHGRMRLGSAPAKIDLVLDTAHGILAPQDPAPADKE
ncbi:MAG: DUF1631 domain-containing protein [Rhodoferax sp.]|nr:DUF1631 domain-containing protein [Rhodoferax sp.]